MEGEIKASREARRVVYLSRKNRSHTWRDREDILEEKYHVLVRNQRSGFAPGILNDIDGYGIEHFLRMIIRKPVRRSCRKQCVSCPTLARKVSSREKFRHISVSTFVLFRLKI